MKCSVPECPQTQDWIVQIINIHKGVLAQMYPSLNLVGRYQFHYHCEHTFNIYNGLPQMKGHLGKEKSRDSWA